MGMIGSLGRWGGGLAAGCAALSALLLPFPRTTPQSWTGAPPAPLAAEMTALTKAAGDAYAAVRTYRNAQALNRWSGAAVGRETTLVRLDASVPPAIAPEVRAIVGEQWRSLGTATSAANAEVYVYVDSTAIPRAAGALAGRRALEPRGLVDVTFALPPATDGTRCVTLVRLRGTSRANVAALGNRTVIGVCGIFAAFGTPGTQVATWLAANAYRCARESDWSVARAPSIDASARYALREPAARCLAGTLGAFNEALGLTSGTRGPAGRSRQRVEWVLDPSLAIRDEHRGVSRSTLGDAERTLLADAVRSLGPERFARFWRAPSPPDAAFAATAGVGLSEWTRQWLARTYGARPARPSVRVRDVVYLVGALAVALLVAATPRQRVLSGRWLATRA